MSDPPLSLPARLLPVDRPDLCYAVLQGQWMDPHEVYKHQAAALRRARELGPKWRVIALAMPLQEEIKVRDDPA